MDKENSLKAKLLSSDIWVPVLFLIGIFVAVSLIGYPYYHNPPATTDNGCIQYR